MEMSESREELLALFKEKITESMKYVESLSECEKTEAWNFWEQMTKLIKEILKDFIQPKNVSTRKRLRGKPAASKNWRSVKQAETEPKEQELLQDKAPVKDKESVIPTAEQEDETEDNIYEGEKEDESHPINLEEKSQERRRLPRRQTRAKRSQDSIWYYSDEEEKKSNVKSQSKRTQDKDKENDELSTDKYDEASNECYYCGEVLSSLHALKTHKLTHTGDRPFKCSICPKAFTTKGNCIRHEFTHTGEKPFKCPECGQGFTEKKSVKVHMRIHTGEKPFKCDICEKAFTQSRMLLSHKYIHTGEKPHLCSICGKAFAQSGQLFTHMIRHKNERRYTCDVCSAKFFFRSDLNRHTRTHSGVRSYLCSYCPKSFNRSQYLKEHMNLHTGLKPYCCKYCDASFPDCSSCYRHTKKFHKDTSNSLPSQGETEQDQPELHLENVSESYEQYQAAEHIQNQTIGNNVYIQDSGNYVQLPGSVTIQDHNGQQPTVQYMELVAVNFPGMSILPNTSQHQF